MIILPAIDIKDGFCVRLFKGDFDTAHRVAENALDTAVSFKNAGAEWLHTVDLDGAKDGVRKNAALISDVARNCGLKVEVGGGIRLMGDVEYYLENGISRVILGSAAVKNPDLVKEAVRLYGAKIAVGIDARGGMVSTEGWLDTLEVNYIDLAKAMEQIGVSTIIFTDISKDGMLSGPNFEQLEAINKAVSCGIIASGGMSSLDDLVKLNAMGMYGAICGKAIYSGDIDLKEAIKLVK